MQIADIIFIIVAVALVILGYLRGFGKSLKTFTGGVVGIIISIFVCIAFGGMILGTELVSGGVSRLNDILVSKWEFLGQIKMAVVIFYIGMFLVVQVLRIVIVKIVVSIFEADNKVMKVVNKAFGMIFAPAITFVFLLLVLSVIKVFDMSDGTLDVMTKIEGSFLAKLYEINPIMLHV